MFTSLWSYGILRPSPVLVLVVLLNAATLLDTRVTLDQKIVYWTQCSLLGMQSFFLKTELELSVDPSEQILTSALLSLKMAEILIWKLPLQNQWFVEHFALISILSVLIHAPNMQMTYLVCFYECYLSIGRECLLKVSWSWHISLRAMYNCVRVLV